MSAPVRLGGMALANGVLVHGPTYWACAVRTESGELRVESGEKTIRSADVRSPVLRGPARVAEALAVLPALRRVLPEARLPFFEPRTAGVMAATALAMRRVRRSTLGPGMQEALGAALALVPALAAVRGTDLAAYHGAEHIAIGSYEHGEPRPREHERCGSHLLGPLLVTTAVGNVAANRVQASPRTRALLRAGVSVGAIALAGELLGWVVRHPDRLAAQALAWPGRQLQTRFLTAEPTADQVAVAQAALDECLRLEREAAEAA